MRVLLISHYFPPLGGAGVQRALKLAKYLPAFDIQPVVLSGADPAYTQDPTLLRELPEGVPVHRMPHSPPLQRWLARRRAAAPRSAAGPADAMAVAGRPSALRGRLRDLALSLHAASSFPDDRAGWARRAHATARRLLRDERIELIFSTAPPMSAHALASRLARESGLPWVADFRDLWTDNPGYAAPAWRRRLDERTLGRWLREASGVVTVTQAWQRQLAVRRGDEHVVLVTNGYDEDDFRGLVPAAADPGVFRLLHVGTFYGHRSPLPALQGVAAYLQRSDARPLRLRLVGNMGGRFEPVLAEFSARHPGVLERLPYLPHRQALAELLGADALLLAVGGEEAATGIPAKVFEYLRAARPILLLGPSQGEAAEVVRRHGRAEIADPGRPDEIAKALAALTNASAEPAPQAGVAIFERRALAHRLAEFLRQCAAGRSRR